LIAGNASTTISDFSVLSGALLLPDPLEHAVASIMIATADAMPDFLDFHYAPTSGAAVMSRAGRHAVITATGQLRTPSSAAQRPIRELCDLDYFWPVPRLRPGAA
jgi:hypothetical protein